ncbi:hypothetical protein HMPREF1212_05067 [Parabacteroides sp. HGS0025]|nr:hypothetical protein HMPREF1212_05093 [Parabacteroides sp. HGS0025]KKB45911.1 hypothetical protein HMPREF1212_05067 [Parabacteroides sp. HGS0025]
MLYFNDLSLFSRNHSINEKVNHYGDNKYRSPNF